MLNKNISLLFLSFCLFAFASCNKENIDNLSNDKEDHEVIVIDCSDFAAEISESDGTISLEVTGGKEPYSFNWSTSADSEFIITDESGVYSVVITDDNECEITKEITVELQSTSCDNKLNLNIANDNMTSFSADSEAYLWKGTCPDGSADDYDHSYLILDITWDAWGTNADPHIWFVSDGLPGITFGSNGLPQVGDELSPYFIGEDLFRIDDNPTTDAFITDNMKVTITETSNVEGGQIGGVLSGTVNEHNNPTVSHDISGSFCVTIVSVCE